MKQSGKCPICHEQGTVEFFKVAEVDRVGLCHNCGGLFATVDMSNGISMEDLFKRAKLVNEIESRRKNTPYERK